MKPKNFPARKMARQYDAALGITRREAENDDLIRTPLLDARAIRTKKRRAIR